LCRCAASIRMLRRGSPGIFASHNSAGRPFSRKIVTRLLVFHAPTIDSVKSTEVGFDARFLLTRFEVFRAEVFDRDLFEADAIRRNYTPHQFFRTTANMRTSIPETKGSRCYCVLPCLICDSASEYSELPGSSATAFSYAAIACSLLPSPSYPIPRLYQSPASFGR
jgi:hypothetical protein